MQYWHVKTNEERLHWTLTPKIGVGPLTFGMTHEEVREALAEHVPRSTQTSAYSGRQRTYDNFRDLGVRVYYTHERLAIVAVDARTGPQVVLDGVRFTGRLPSELEQQLAGHPDLWTTQEGHLSLPEHCIVARVQRAGDVVLTRPVVALPESAVTVWESFPQAELRTFV